MVSFYISFKNHLFSLCFESAIFYNNISYLCQSNNALKIQQPTSDTFKLQSSLTRDRSVALNNQSKLKEQHAYNRQRSKVLHKTPRNSNPNDARGKSLACPCQQLRLLPIPRSVRDDTAISFISPPHRRSDVY